ncbi:MAG TPA: zf-HC2 domain-containing protein [Candidatus Limnocylindrales bacterium]|nr:zf-HC2 domain-containing protein [Candidatus Limnocylindrales bacterium]
MIDCREAVRRMWAYLEHELEAKPVSEFEAHLETCQRCCGELEFSRYLREMVAEKEAPPVPPELRSRIEILLAQGEQSSGNAS